MPTTSRTPSIVLACLTSSSQDPLILRMAQRHARARDVNWCVVYLELWDDQKETRAHSRNKALEQVAMAERMGASTFIIKAGDYGKAFQEALAECTRRGVAPALVVLGGASPAAPQSVRRTVQVIEEIAGNQYELMLVVPSETPKARLNWLRRLHMRRLTLPAVLWALTAILIAFFVNALLQSVLPVDSKSLEYTHTFLIYLIAIAGVAGRFGLMPGMIATVASFIAMKIFTIVPLYTLRVDAFEDCMSLALFIATGTVISLVNSQVHAEAEASEINEWRMQALLQVYKIALHARSRNEALAELHSKLHQFLRAEIAVFMPGLVGPVGLQQVWPENEVLGESERDMLHRGWEDLQSGHEVMAAMTESGWRFEPLVSATGELGMLALRVPAAEATDIHFDQYLHMIADLVASILEKIESTDMKEESRVRDEREKLRTSLLSSVSHDLKTPLAAILGSLSVHRSMYDKLPEAQRHELTNAALTEAQRLDSFITNILDLAKIESGAVKFKREWQSPDDLVQRVKKRMRTRFERHQLVVHPFAHEVEIEIDPVMSEQALFNIFDNAVKYTPDGSTITVRMETQEGRFLIHVQDQGPGIAEEDRERIFDKYTRLQRQDHQVAGTGLGLAVARAAMRGQGGDVEVAPEQQGALFTLCWPSWRMSASSSGPRLVKTA